MRSGKQSVGEFDLIARLVKGMRLSARAILGPGDDCAILAPAKRPQLFTIDSMVEGVHFRLEWGTPEELGAKALSVNLSDIAAMGGKPVACVINLGVRDGLAANFFDRLYRGIKQVAAKYQTDVVGGNVTRSDQLSITIALLGDASEGVMRRDRARVGDDIFVTGTLGDSAAGLAISRSDQLSITIALLGDASEGVMRRDRARVGDDIFVTGTLGDSAAGLAILSGKMKAGTVARTFLIERHLNPTPRIEAGLALAKIRPAPAAIDISDGLLQDLGHILKRSRVGAEIDAPAIP